MMLDLGKAKRRRAIAVPTALKFMFLCIPWVFVAYGVFVLKDMLAFYNNSVPVQAEVVLAEASPVPTTPEAARRAELADPRWYRPGFLYVHENGQAFVGGAIVESLNWNYQPGQVLEVRYNRVAPQQAQPVTLLKFWWSPVSFIAGGVLAFVSIAVAFWLAEREPLPGHSRRRRKGPNLRAMFGLRREEGFSLRRN